MDIGIGPMKFDVGFPVMTCHHGETDIKFHRPNTNVHPDSHTRSDLESSVDRIVVGLDSIHHHALSVVVCLRLKIKYVLVHKSTVTENCPADPIFQNWERSGNLYLIHSLRATTHRLGVLLRTHRSSVHRTTQRRIKPSNRPRTTRKKLIPHRNVLGCTVRIH